jgi:hypothetical protein
MRTGKFFEIFFVLCFIASMTLISGGLFIAIHFIQKYW